MRHSHHAPGSPAAQAALASLAGWAPSRRGFLNTLLVLSSGAVATCTAAAIPAVSIAASVPSPGLSSRMAELIAEYSRLSAALDDAEASGDLIAFDSAAEARRPALEALVFERPTSLIDLAAKLTALSQYMTDEDTENFAFRRLAEDATLLAGSAAK
jgi:hypothetical protein